MSNLMRTIDIRGGKGNAKSLYIHEIQKPTPTGSQALVRVKAFGLNRMDLLQREGKYPVPPQAPATLGVEFSGVIEGLAGATESGFKVGDQVFGLAYGGAYAEYIAVSTHMLIHKPTELSFEECAGIPETFLTAIQALHVIGEFRPGKSVLWHAGASGVSLAGIQLSRLAGASAVYATSRSESKLAFLMNELGATAAFSTADGADWSVEVMQATAGKGVDIVIDFVGAPYFAGNLAAAARDGVIVHLGAMGGTKLSAGTDMGAFIRKRLRFEGSSLRSRDEAYQRKLRDRLVEEALPGLREGNSKVFVEKVMPWEKIVEAHLLMESNETRGKIICTIN